MKTIRKKRCGFSLIELVATMMLASVLAGGSAALVVYVAQGYNTVRQHAGLAQGAELAIGRLIREVRRADGISGTGGSITFTRGGLARLFSMTDGTLGMQVGGVTYPLMRNVAGFDVARTASGGSEMITFTIAPTGNNLVFTTAQLVVPVDD